MKMEPRTTSNLAKSMLSPLKESQLSSKVQACPLSIRHQNVIFNGVEPNQKYEMQVVLKNEGRDNEKIRLIYPTSEFFTVKTEANPFIIAPGLSHRISVYFYVQSAREVLADKYCDKVVVIGQSYQQEISLEATKLEVNLQIPKFFKLGFVQLGKEARFCIPIRNRGRDNIEITRIKSSSSSVALESTKLVIRTESETLLRIKVLRNAIGMIEEYIDFPSGDRIELRGICNNQKIEIYNQEGKPFVSQGFGQLYVGEKISYEFCIANNTSSKIEGLAKVFSSEAAEYSNVKVDLAKINFVNRNNPRKMLEEERNVAGRCQIQKFEIEPFHVLENKLFLLKQPTPQQLKQFVEEGTLTCSGGLKTRQSYNTSIEATQILYVKIVSVEQPVRIPLSFSLLVPRVEVTQDKFEFEPTLPKKASRIKFTIKNSNQRAIHLKLPSSKYFHIEGAQVIPALEERLFEACFRPVVPGEFYEEQPLTVFDSWPKVMKFYGQCMAEPIATKPMRINLNKSVSHQNIKSARYLEQVRSKRMQLSNLSYLRNKVTERTSMGFNRSPDLPMDLAFEACENPKVLKANKFGLRTVLSQASLKQQDDPSGIPISNKKNSINSSRLNLKQLIKLSEELTANQLAKIEVSADKLDFGSVFVGSLNERQLKITNKNNKTIIVELDVEAYQALSQTRVEIKKAEPFGSVKFLISFKPGELGQTRIPVRYIINKHHIFEIDLVANVTLINLTLSAKELKFGFRNTELSFEKSQTLMVQNHGTMPTKFSIAEPSNKAFVVPSDQEFEVAPKSSIPVLVKYCPLEGMGAGQVRTDTDNLVIKVTGGAQNVVKLEGSVLDPKYSVKQTQINLGEVFVSTPHQSKVTVRNSAKIEAAISIELSPASLSEYINLDQRSFILHSEERKQVMFRVLSHEAKLVKGHLVVTARGGKVHRIQLSINFCLPRVDILDCQHGELNLGAVHIMTNHFEREVTLVNRSKSEVRLEASKEDPESLDYFIEFIAANQRVETHIRDSYQQSEDGSQVNIRNFSQKILTSTNIKNHKRISRTITLAPGMPTKFKIRFIPKCVKQYLLKIPLYLHKALRTIEPISQRIRCRGVEPLFYVNPYKIDFNDVIITDNQKAHCKEFEIINSLAKQVDWQVADYPEAVSRYFIFEETKGKLSPKEAKKLRVFFSPEKEGAESYKFRLFSEQAPDVEVELQVSGSAVLPRISFNRSNLILPVVPIKAESKAVLEIENNGYEAVTISRAKFTKHFDGVDLRYSFIQGKLLSLAKKKIKVEISFQSDIPVSLTTELEVYDEFGEKISIPISLTADCCLLTTYPYVQSNNVNIILDHVDNTYKLQSSKAFASKSKPVSMSGSSAVTASFIRKWCNYELNIQMNRFPEDLIASKGSLLYELVIKMTNGRPIIKKPCFNEEEADRVSLIMQLYAYYSEIIRTLQGEGAFLNHIRPELLLSANDYILYMSEKDLILAEEQFECISHEAWTTLFYQLCRLYFEPIITEKFIQKFNPRYKFQRTRGSLVYSENQMLLLELMSYYMGEQSLVNIGDHAKVFQLIQRIIEKTFKLSLADELTKLKMSSDSVMVYQFLIILSKFLFANLQQFGLSMYLESNDLFTMGHKQFIVFFISLLQNLICLQNSACVQFSCASGQKSEKALEIENPSKKNKIKYWVKMFGSCNFKVNCKELQIDPGDKKVIKVTYNCKKNSDEEGHIILVPVKDEYFFTSARSMKFNLKNNLISKTVMKKINIKTVLYEIKTTTIDIELPFKQQKQFDIKAVGNPRANSQLPNYYLTTNGRKVLRNGKDKCQVKIAPLELNDFTFKVVYTFNMSQEYIYQFNVHVGMPNAIRTFTLQPMTTDKQQVRLIKIPQENELKQACLRVHHELNKVKQTKKELPQTSHSIAGRKTARVKYEAQFQQESYFQLVENQIELRSSYKVEAATLELKANFNKPYREYKSTLIVKNEELHDYRVYLVTTNVSIRPKIFDIRMQTKARQPIRALIPNKISPFSFRLLKNTQNFLKVEPTEGTELTAIFQPSWVMNQEAELFIENIETFQQHIYKIKLEASFPDPIKSVTICGGHMFQQQFEIEIPEIGVPLKQLAQAKISTNIRRQHKIQIKAQEKKSKVAGCLQAGEEQEGAIIKIYANPRNQSFYEIIVNIKNQQLFDLGIVRLTQTIGETRRYMLKEIDVAAKDFHYDYQPEPYFEHYMAAEEAKSLTRSTGNRPYFWVAFKPCKEIQQTKVMRFRFNNKQYQVVFELECPKVQPVMVPPIVCENLQRMSMVFAVANSFQSEGVYDIVVEDEKRFRVEMKHIDMKMKDKANIKITYLPQFIGDCSQTKVFLRSQVLPELTYCVQGISKFKPVLVEEEIESCEGLEASKQMSFKNQFNHKEKFKFEILSSTQSYLFQNQAKTAFCQLQSNEVYRFTIKNTRQTADQNEENEVKVIASRCRDKKIVTQYQLRNLIVKALEDKKYSWSCTAREAVFETIRLAEECRLKQIRADPEIQKYISFSNDEGKGCEVKVKFLPMKPIKPKTYAVVLVCDSVKFRINCQIRVLNPPVDDTITIRTADIKETGISVFKLTNTTREPAPYRAHFEKNSNQLEVDPQAGVLEAYGKGGTPIQIKFKSEVHNKKVQDKLIIETESMYWSFRVVGVQEKLLNF